MSKIMKQKLADGTEYVPSREGIPARSIAPSSVARWVTGAVLFLVLVYFLFPVYWVIVASTKTNSQLVSTNGFWFDDINVLKNHETLMVWTRGMFWRWVFNSLLYSTVAGVVGTLISVMAGYATAKFKFPGKGVTMGVIMSGLLMPAALLTIPLYIIFHHIGITNTMWAIIIPACVSPFGVFLGRVYAQTSVPTELIEAARIDGASEARIFFTMVLRLLAPAMVTIFLFIFVGTWNNFLLPLMMVTADEIKPVTLGLYGMMSYFAPEKGAVMLGALLGVLPLIVLFLALQKYWQSGLAAGSVKG
ncbi:carbohydrate ABC transporter permease [Arcanobacterium haemolyticum]|uniref:Binding-protein-dependent transport systems inner membrane component n=1 Tax=Arcanobacterium haemolyticum (strain ATCC 9345 / DSM 20595 / CCM 5947 / CCUG 17215 / LMG 16163 / NBRC 15585 / NCTC 8452 / 11018) TaxID=644284 RepID=D7BM08_ARCHD|nr:carbohydrate ABC transporter permease [Arcanobacterium haemolyticum]ADH91957.1 binding-protein-dependent transport systems inner membrane component [Arcanobacterium haemolyticum DSM 20595]QCX46139.1 carbohydrate ABC transporter permease [Arcanobacterium haemolyticum]SQH29341.1 Inner membrane ABC transporter permease protein ycjP [Arcanobacterium haemolyticum]